jgi:ankyrin repeat protein
VISKLTRFLNEGGIREKIEALEDVIVESMDEVVKEDGFYSLPTNEILTILQKSSIESVELLSSIVTKMNEGKGEESPLLLNVIDPKNATFDECISIISKFTKCPLCRRIGELHDDNIKLPNRDYEHEIEELKESKKVSSKKADFARVTGKPSDFESDIHNAAEKGKLTSVQYLYEVCHSNVEAKDKYGKTPIIFASENGHLEVVKYLYEKCHATITDEAISRTKNDDIKNYLEENSIHIAASKGDLAKVKYLHEECHANVEATDNFECTPIICASAKGHLEVVKYLYEECHANVEARSQYGYTPIIFASVNGHLEVVKYLVEECHATITSTAISEARKDEIRRYLQSKR